MKRVGRLLVLSACLSLVLPTAIYAHYLDWTPTGYQRAIACCYTTVTTGDTYRPRVSGLYWNATKTTNLRHMLTGDGRSDYFTHDSKDNHDNLNATGSGYTTLPAPYFDIDDDNGNRKWEEAEVTSEQQVFPNSNQQYYAGEYFMRWWKSCPQCGWQWDGDAGSITQVAQLSFRSCGVCDKYDADPNYLSFTFGTDNYGSAAAAASASAVSSPEVAQMLEAFAAWETAELNMADAAPAPEPLAESIEIGITADEGELLVKPDLSGGIDAYRENASELARALVASGPARGVATFARPLSAAELAVLDGLGLQILSIEAVTDLHDGVRGTYFGMYSATAWLEMGQLSEEFATTFIGVTAAQVVVPDMTALDALTTHPDVYLVDVSLEQVRRATGETDVVMNDLYWHMAGW